MSRRTRVDESGRAYAGSQLQIQTYVNRHPELLATAVLKALPDLAALKPHLRWVAPLKATGYEECQDRTFLEALGL